MADSGWFSSWASEDLAHGDQARGLFEALLLLQIDFLNMLLVSDVSGNLDAHGAPVTQRMARSCT
jgi:hypothetical protein